MKIRFFTVLAMLYSSHAHAHPGEHHMFFPSGIVHLLTEPDHLAMLLVAVLAGASGAYFYRRRSQMRRQNKRQ